MKPLMPSLRESKRYLAFEVVSEKKMNFKTVEKAVEDACLGFFGSFGWSKANLKLVEYNDNKGIIMMNHDGLDMVRSALLTINSIDNKKASIATKGVSGILKKAKGRYF
jgi:ribonuclease P/MRP protein subunit POP5